jgi:hypothetical protein
MPAVTVNDIRALPRLPAVDPATVSGRSAL